MNKIMRRHWNALARRCGFGVSAELVIQELIAQTPAVVTAVEDNLPADFPAEVAETIFLGLRSAVDRLAAMPVE